MRAIVFDRPGGVEVLRVAEVADPARGAGELLVRNFATALNRADILQRLGRYPPPPGESEILGLEFAGEVLEADADAGGSGAYSVGDRVFGLIAGGGYAEKVRVPTGLALPIPDTLSFEAAAAVPEVFFTANEALFTHGGLRAGETVLIHAGASGVGTAAIQLARRLGATVITTAGSQEKLERCRELGADHGVLRGEDFATRARDVTGGRGVDVIVDCVGAAYWDANVAALARDGRLVVIGLLGGARVEADLATIVMRRLRVVGTAMRGLPLADKLAIAERFRRDVLPDLAAGRLKPVIDSVHMLEDVQAAHRRMEENLNIGKIVLRM